MTIPAVRRHPWFSWSITLVVVAAGVVVPLLGLRSFFTSDVGPNVDGWHTGATVVVGFGFAASAALISVASAFAAPVRRLQGTLVAFACSAAAFGCLFAAHHTVVPADTDLSPRPATPASGVVWAVAAVALQMFAAFVLVPVAAWAVRPSEVSGRVTRSVRAELN